MYMTFIEEIRVYVSYYIADHWSFSHPNDAIFVPKLNQRNKALGYETLDASIGLSP